MGHSQALMVVGSPNEEHRTLMKAKVNDLLRTSMHSVCMVRPSQRRSSVHMQVLGEVGSLVYTQAINRCGFSQRGTHLVDCDQGIEYLMHDLVLYLDSHGREDSYPSS